MSRRFLLLLAVLSSLAGCDQLGLEAASVTAARLEADGRAVGAACRHGGRAIEDCFALNRRVDKAAIYAGWREMDDYMRENKLEAVVPTLGPGGKPKPAEPGLASTASAPAPLADADVAQEKPAEKMDATLPVKSSKAEKIARLDKPVADMPPVGKPVVDRVVADRAAVDKPTVDKSASGKTASATSATGRAAGAGTASSLSGADKPLPR